MQVERGALWRAGAELSRQQSVNNATSTHGAGWSTPTASSCRARRRRPAQRARQGAGASRAPNTGVDGFILVAGRASYEMVQKAAFCGVELVAAIARPTGLAIRFADAAGVTLVGLLRGESANVYTHPERIHPLSLEV